MRNPTTLSVVRVVAFPSLCGYDNFEFESKGKDRFYQRVITRCKSLKVGME